MFWPSSFAVTDRVMTTLESLVEYVLRIVELAEPAILVDQQVVAEAVEVVADHPEAVVAEADQAEAVAVHKEDQCHLTSILH